MTLTDNNVEHDIFPTEDYQSENEPAAPTQTVQPSATLTVCADRTQLRSVAVENLGTGRVTQLCSHRGNFERARVIIGVTSGSIYLMSQSEVPTVLTILDFDDNELIYVSTGILLEAGDTYTHVSGAPLYAIGTADQINGCALVSVIEDSYYRNI